SSSLVFSPPFSTFLLDRNTRRKRDCINSMMSHLQPRGASSTTAYERRFRMLSLMILVNWGDTPSPITFSFSLFSSSSFF
ncbi:hypothetical protein PENTCL1PPCAC_30330, partial [Pristionchus entomophagus]